MHLFPALFRNLPRIVMTCALSAAGCLALTACGQEERIDLLSTRHTRPIFVSGVPAPSSELLSTLENEICTMTFPATMAREAPMPGSSRVLHYSLPLPPKSWTSLRPPDEMSVTLNASPLPYVSPQMVKGKEEEGGHAGVWSVQGRELTVLLPEGVPGGVQVEYEPLPSALHLAKSYYADHIEGTKRLSLISQYASDRYIADAMAVPSTSTVRFPVTLPRNAILGFGTAAQMLDPAESLSKLYFNITVRNSRGSFPLYNHDFRMEPQGVIRPSFFQARLPEEAAGPSEVVFTVSTPLGGSAVAYWLSPVIYSATEKVNDRPNVILISIDTLRADHLSFMGYDRPTSPSIDELADRSVVFNHAYAAASWTLPSHASMLTGLLPKHHGANRRNGRLRDGVDTLAELLQGQGYETFALTSQTFLAPGRGFEQGFDILGYFQDCRASVAVDQSIEWIDSFQPRPFFLFLHLFDPHMDYDPPPPFNTLFDPEYVGSMTGKLDQIMKTLNEQKTFTERDLRHIVALYDGEIAGMDREIGRFIQWLRQRDLFDNTILILTSDHGEEFLDHDSMGHGETLYEEQVHVPLVISWPKGLAARRVEDAVSLVDIVPTTLDLLGGPVPKTDGLSLVSLIRKDKKLRRNLIIAEHEKTDNLIQAGVSFPYKVIKGSAPMLFNVLERPRELHNLTGEMPDVHARLEGDLAAALDYVSQTVLEVYVKSPRDRSHSAFLSIPLPAAPGPVTARYQEPEDSFRLVSGTHVVQAALGLSPGDLDDVSIWLADAGADISLQWELTPSPEAPVPVHMGSSSTHVTDGVFVIEQAEMLSKENEKCEALGEEGAWGIFIMISQRSGHRPLSSNGASLGSMSAQERELLERIGYVGG